MRWVDLQPRKVFASDERLPECVERARKVEAPEMGHPPVEEVDLRSDREFRVTVDQRSDQGGPRPPEPDDKDRMLSPMEAGISSIS